MKNKTLRFFLLLLIVVSSISCDQLSKRAAREQLDYMQPVHVMDGFLSLIRVENTGAFLSLGHSWPVPLTIGITAVIGKRAQKQFIAQWTHTGALNAQIEEGYTGHALVKVFGRHAEVEGQFAEKNQELYRASFGGL